MGNWKAVVPILIALIIALSGSFLLYRWVQNQKGNSGEITKGSEHEVTSVVVAKVDLPWGTKITPELIKKNPYLKNKTRINKEVVFYKRAYLSGNE